MDVGTLKIEDVIKSLSAFHNLFDMIRVIDPIKKSITHCESPRADSFGFICYDFWKKDKQCENCVSGRALLEDDTVIKLECQSSKIFMVMASPISLRGKAYIVEMIKDITDNNIMEGVYEKHIEENNKVITELNKSVVTDYLTGLYNRKYINERLPVDILEATSNNRSLSVLMIDIDLFKDVNDTYGHLAGDTTLQIISKIMKGHVKKDTGWVARYGGEEFLILLQDANQTAAYKIAEKIREAIEKEIIKHINYTFKVTISIGTYTLEAGTSSFNEVIEKVDKNLYQAKHQGRNKTISS